MSMNEEIIQMAKEAGLHRQQHNLMSNPMQYRFSYDGYEEHLERFYSLAVAAERVACAKMVSNYIFQTDNMEARGCLASVAYDILARGQE